MPSRQLCVAWFGPTHAGLGWLRRQLDKAYGAFPAIEVRQFPAVDRISLSRILEDGGVDRLLWACSTRIDYPHEEIDFSLRDYPEVPLAVACESWWDGSRRSGMRVLPHLSLPWYRWWDGWSVWLEGSAPELFGPCQNSPAPWSGSSWFTLPALRHDESSHSHDVGCGIVVGNCRQTCNAWRRLAARGFGLSHPDNSSRVTEIEVISWARYQARLQSRDFPQRPNWVLWDDSCLDTSAASRDSAATMEGFFALTGPVFESALLIAALSMPRATQWLKRSGSDQHEFIVKPDSGQALIRLLQYRAPGFEHRTQGLTLPRGL